MVKSGYFAKVLALGAMVCGLQAAQASVVVYDFESFNDADSLTTQLSGLSFANATVLVAGVSLNETAFPPHSGSNVVFDDGGAITIDFASPVFGIGAFFNYATGLSVRAYDANQQLLGSVFSLFDSNLSDGSGDAGSSANEYLSLASGGGLISRLVVTGDALGGSFTLDDLSVDIGNDVPEPGSLALALVALAVGCSRRRPAAAGPKRTS